MLHLTLLSSSLDCWETSHCNSFLFIFNRVFERGFQQGCCEPVDNSAKTIYRMVHITQLERITKSMAIIPLEYSNYLDRVNYVS